MLEAASDPDVVDNEYVTTVDYPDFGKTLRVHGAPWRFSETPAQIGRAPALGEHNHELRARHGYDSGAVP